MANQHDILVARLRALREMCTAAHNELLADVGSSPLGELVRALSPEIHFEQRSPPHLLLSSYVYWGSRKLGGSRSGLERRLSRHASEVHLELHRELRKAAPGVWECLRADAGERSRWRPVGLPDRDDCSVEMVFDGKTNPVEPEVGELRVGWMIEEEGARLLIFSMALVPEAVDTLAETAAGDGWHDPHLSGDAAFQRLEYERDVLTLAVCPEWEECGLEEYYFLPANQRSTFPEKFRRNLLRRLVDRLRFQDRNSLWHIKVAKADDAWFDEYVRPRFDEMREIAGRQAMRYRNRCLESDILRRVVPDDEVLSLVGLDSDGSLLSDPFSPIDTHRLEFLDLAERWFEATGVSHVTTIYQARERLDDDEYTRQFEAAVERHRSRLRWLGVAEYIVENWEFDKWTLSLGYGDVRAAAGDLFGPIVLERSVAELLADFKRAGLIESRIGEGLGADSPLVVADLPDTESGLKCIYGIGFGSVETITNALLDMIQAWAVELRRGNVESKCESRAEIEAGLDELDALF